MGALFPNIQTVQAVEKPLEASSFETLCVHQRESKQVFSGYWVLMVSSANKRLTTVRGVCGLIWTNSIWGLPLKHTTPSWLSSHLNRGLLQLFKSFTGGSTESDTIQHDLILSTWTTSAVAAAVAQVTLEGRRNCSRASWKWVWPSAACIISWQAALTARQGNNWIMVVLCFIPLLPLFFCLFLSPLNPISFDAAVVDSLWYLRVRLNTGGELWRSAQSAESQQGTTWNQRKSAYTGSMQPLATTWMEDEWVIGNSLVLETKWDHTGGPPAGEQHQTREHIAGRTDHSLWLT